MQRFSLKSVLIAVAIFGLLLSIITMYRDYSARHDPFNKAVFSSAKWQNSFDNDRGIMVRDLIRSHLNGSMSESEVVKLLGPPNDTFGGSFGAAGRHPTYSYYIGSWSNYGYDSAFLYIRFDKNGNVGGTEITGY